MNSDAFPVNNYFDLRPHAGGYPEITSDFLNKEYDFMTQTLGISHQKALSTLIYIATKVEGYDMQRILGEETLAFLDSKGFDYNSPLHLTSKFLIDHHDDSHPRTKYLVAYACETRNLNLLKALYSRGANLDIEVTYDFMYDRYGELTSSQKPSIRNCNEFHDDERTFGLMKMCSMPHLYNAETIKFLQSVLKD